MRPFSPIAIYCHLASSPHTLARDGVSARQGDEVTLSSTTLTIPCPTIVRRGPDSSGRSRLILVSSIRSTKLHDKKQHYYLQCARTPEQARSFRDARRLCSLKHREPTPLPAHTENRRTVASPRPQSLHRDREAHCQGTGWHANEWSTVRERSLPHRWSRGDSNPGPPPCKGGALPAKLRPRAHAPLTLLAQRRSSRGVGAPGLEPGTSALSGPRSDHLSYAPKPHAGHSFQHHTVPSSAQDGARDPRDDRRLRRHVLCKPETGVRGSVRDPQRQFPPCPCQRPCQPLTLPQEGTRSGLGA